MNNNIKKSNSWFSRGSGQEGFLELIIVIVIALLLMRYYGVTISGVIFWFKSFFASVLR